MVVGLLVRGGAEVDDPRGWGAAPSLATQLSITPLCKPHACAYILNTVHEYTYMSWHNLTGIASLFAK